MLHAELSLCILLTQITSSSWYIYGGGGGGGNDVTGRRGDGGFGGFGLYQQSRVGSLVQFISRVV